MKQKQHYTVSSSEDVESLSKSQSWKGDIKSNFEWEPKTKVDTSNLPTIPSTHSAPPHLQSASESHISPPLSSPLKYTSVPKPLTRGHSLTTSNVALPTSNPPPTTPKRFSLLTDPLPSPPPPSDNQPHSKMRGLSVPPKPNIPTFKEFRPEKREKVDLDELRLSYEPSQSSPRGDKEKDKENDKGKEKRSTSNGHSKRSPSRNSVGPDKVFSLPII